VPKEVAVHNLARILCSTVKDELLVRQVLNRESSAPREPMLFRKHKKEALVPKRHLPNVGKINRQNYKRKIKRVRGQLGEDVPDGATENFQLHIRIPSSILAKQRR
jgi:hypothetical protein